MSSEIIQQLKEYFTKFPGIGSRQAQRFVYWLLTQDSEFVRNLSALLLELKKNVKQCGKCFSFHASGECKICHAQNRDRSRIMVVEKDVDFENIEKIGVYNGLYFILGGVISLGQNSGRNLHMKELFNRVKSNAENGLKEIILALNATTEGDSTARYIEKILEPLAGKYQIKITHFGRGLSTGTELEYIDSDTLKNALENRK